MMKVLLINPYLNGNEEDPAQPAPMVNLPYVTACLEKNGCKVSILDVAGQGWANIVAIGDKQHCGIVQKKIAAFIE